MRYTWPSTFTSSRFTHPFVPLGRTGNSTWIHLQSSAVGSSVARNTSGTSIGGSESVCRGLANDCIGAGSSGLA